MGLSLGVVFTKNLNKLANYFCKLDCFFYFSNNLERLYKRI
jgi:hypothetical protein